MNKKVSSPENPTLIELGVYQDLTNDEKELIIKAVQHRRRMFPTYYFNITKSTLPFFNSWDTLWCLQQYYDSAPMLYMRIHDRRIEYLKKLRNSQHI